MSASLVHVLCEGYHDRAFWAGLLLHTGWTDARGGGRAAYPDGKPVEPGVFAFKQGEAFAAVKLGGGTRLSETLRVLVRRLGSEDPKANHLVVSLDVDTFASETPTNAATTLSAQINRVAAWTDETWTRAAGPVIALASGLRVTVIPWFVVDKDEPNLPRKQTLERLIVAALVEAHPERAQHVRSWLENCGSLDEPKAWSWSHMAGWFASHGCDDFLRHVWREPGVANALGAQLTKAGLWAALTELGGRERESPP